MNKQRFFFSMEVPTEKNTDEEANAANTSEDTNEKELEILKTELDKTKLELNEAKSEVAVCQILQENLESISRQKVGFLPILIH